MPTSSVSLSHAAKNALAGSLADCAQNAQLSQFDYAQMCLALVNVARRIQDLKAAENQHTTTQEEQA